MESAMKIFGRLGVASPKFTRYAWGSARTLSEFGIALSLSQVDLVLGVPSGNRVGSTLSVGTGSTFLLVSGFQTLLLSRGTTTFTLFVPPG